MRHGGALLDLRILAVGASVPLLLRLDLERVQRLLEPRRAPRAAPDDVRVRELATRVDRVLLAARPLVRPGCLSRGVTLYYILRRAGVDVRLVFGVGKPNEGVEGHCWLVKDDEPFLEAVDPRPIFTEMVSIPARGTA